MKNVIKISAVTFFTILLFSSNCFSRTTYIEDKSDSLIILEKYSLFSEYYKNKDCESALPYGWQVLEMDPAKFSKWIYKKMDYCLTFMHDSSDASPEYKQAIEDTILGFYDMAMIYNADKMSEWQLRKAYVTETWFDFEPEVAIAEYEKVFEYNPETHSYYYHRLGQLYVDNISDDNDYKLKAKLLYTDLKLKEPDNPLWDEELLELVEDMGEILDILETSWKRDKDNLGKAWDYAKACMANESWERAIEPLEFLTQNKILLKR